jgi:hypothetical protein
MLGSYLKGDCGSGLSRCCGRQVSQSSMVGKIGHTGDLVMMSMRLLRTESGLIILQGMRERAAIVSQLMTVSFGLISRMQCLGVLLRHRLGVEGKIRLRGQDWVEAESCRQSDWDNTIVRVHWKQTPLAKFENVSAYYEWSDRDRLFHLKASLEGHAGEVLWEVDRRSSEADVIKLLKNRFSCDNQVERFRAELRTRRRKRGESIQSVYQDIRRLLALGFPGQAGELCETIGRDAFLEALGDPSLGIRVLDQQPKTLDDALSIVCRMEAYSVDSGVQSSHTNEELSRRRVRSVTANATKPAPDETTVEDGRLQRLEECLASQEQVMRQLHAENVEWEAQWKERPSSPLNRLL